MTGSLLEKKPTFDFDVIKKDPIEVIIRTRQYFILATMYFRPAVRLVDALIASEQFWPLTDATVIEPNGKVAFRSKFMVVRRDDVEWVIPKNDLISKATAVDASGTAAGEAA